MDLLIKLGMSSVIVALCLTPTWVYLLARSLLEPEGFWQNLFLAGLGFWFLGSLQFCLAIVGLALLVGILLPK